MAEIKEEKEFWQEIGNLRTEMYQEFEKLRKEMYEEFKQVREEIHRVEVSLREEIHKLRILMVVVIFLIIFLNQNALEFIFRVLGLIR